MPEFEPNSSSDRTLRKRNMLLYKEEKLNPTTHTYHKHSPNYQFRFQLSNGKTNLYTTCTSLKECLVVPYTSGTIEYIIMVNQLVTTQDILNHLPIVNTDKSLVYAVQILDYYPSYTIKINYKFTNRESSWDGFSFYNVQTPALSVYAWYNTYCTSVSIVSFGNIPLSRAGYQFYSVQDLSISSSTTPIILPYTTGYKMFYECINFSPIQLQWNTSVLTSMEQMFYGCSEFKPSVIEWDLSSVASMNETFMNCTKFNPFIFTLSNTSQVVTSKRTLKGCSSFTTDVRSWNLSHSTDLSEMFYGCILCSVNLSEWSVLPTALHVNFNTNSSVVLPQVWV